MPYNYFRSKPLIYFMIWAFLLLIAAESVPALGTEKAERAHTGPVVRVKAARGLTPAQQAQFDQLMEEGKRLYDNMDNEAAIQRFLQARQLAQTSQQKSDVYFYLSLAYYGLLEEGRSNEFSNALNKLVEVDYYRQLDSELCPQRLIDMFEEIKKGYGVVKISSMPSGADVYINNSRTSAGLTPLTMAAKAGEVRLEIKKGKQKKKASLRVEAGKETQSPVYELKGGSSMIFILGGALVGGGVLAAVALGGGGGNGNGNGGPSPPPPTGSITVSSTPSGATVFLDGGERGITPVTISSVSAGDHVVLVVKEGYLDYEQAVTVTANQDTPVNATLGQHTISITQPQQNSEWVLGEDTLEIRWSTADSSSQGAHRIAALSRASASNALGAARFAREQARRRAASSGYTRTGSARMNPSAVASGVRSRIQQIRTDPGRAVGVSAPGPSPSLSRTPLMTSQGGDLRISRLNTVRIDLLKSGEAVLNIVETSENDGVFDWTIPADLEADNDYRIRIASVDSSEVNATSPRFTLRGPSDVPAAPTNLKADPHQATSSGSLTYQVTISWKDKSDNETGFKVHRSDSVNTKWKVVADLAAGKKTYTDTGLNGDRQYIYRVFAYNDDGDSGYSNEVEVRIVDTPTNVSVASLAGPKAGVSWTDNSSIESGFIIERRVDSGSWAVLGNTGANVTYYEDSSVSVGHTYSYRVRAVSDAFGELAYSLLSNVASVAFL